MTNEQKRLSQVCSLLLKIALETFSLCSTPSGQGNRAIFCLLHLWGINSPPETCSTQSWIYSALLQEEDSRAHLPSQCIGLKSENEHTHKLLIWNQTHKISLYICIAVHLNNKWWAKKHFKCFINRTCDKSLLEGKVDMVFWQERIGCIQ